MGSGKYTNLKIINVYQAADKYVWHLGLLYE